MFSFSEFVNLKESVVADDETFNGIKFSVGHDSDFPARKEEIVMFGYGDLKYYREEGQTHGLVSHAIKHLREFDQETVQKLILEVREKIKQYVVNNVPAHDKNYKFEFFVNGVSTPLEGTSLEQQISSVPDTAIINYLDFVNDKIKLNKSLTEFEKSLTSTLKKFKKDYVNFIKLVTENTKLVPYTNNPEEIKDFIFANAENGFRFTLTDGSIVYVNPKYKTFSIKRNDAFGTLFVLNRYGRGVMGYVASVTRKIRASQIENPGFRRFIFAIKSNKR